MSARLAGQRTSFWLATAGVSLLGMFALQVAVDRLGSRVPALRDFRNYLVHSEGV